MEIFYPFCELYIYGKKAVFAKPKIHLSLSRICVALNPTQQGVQSRDGIDIYKNTTEEGMNLCA